MPEMLELTTNEGEKFQVFYDPNYNRKCCVCGAAPCVRIRFEGGKVFYDGDMCGVCTWGDAAAIDPSNW
jgi:hypothetical protein